MSSFEEYRDKVDKKVVGGLYKSKVDLSKIKEYVFLGLSDAEISRLLGIHVNTLYSWKVQGAPFLRREYKLIKDGVHTFKELRPYGYNSGYTPLYEILTLSNLDNDELERYLWDIHGAAREGYTTKESRYVGGDYEIREISYGRDLGIELGVLDSIIRYKEKRSQFDLDREIKLANLELARRAQDLAELRYSNRISDKEYEYELKKGLYDKRAELRRELIESGEYDVVDRLGEIIEELDYNSSDEDE